METFLTVLSLTTASLAVCFGYFICDYRKRISALKRLKNSLSSSSTGGSRVLTAIEAFFDTGQRNDEYIITDLLVVDSLNGKRIDETLLRKASSRVAAKHPMLRMRMRDQKEASVTSPMEDAFLVFEEMPNFHPDVEITSEKWTAIFDKEFCKGFPRRGPLWRVKLVDNDDGIVINDVNKDNNDTGNIDDDDDSSSLGEKVEGTTRNILIFSFHHGIIDGQSVMRFYDELLDQLRACAEVEEAGRNEKKFTEGDDDGNDVDDDDAEVDSKIKSMPLPPSANDACPKLFSSFNVVLKFGLYLLAKLRITFAGKLPPLPRPDAYCDFLKLTREKNDSRLTKSDDDADDDGRISKMIPIDVSRELTHHLIRATKTNGCKMTGTLEAVAHVALAATILDIRRRHHRRRSEDNEDEFRDSMAGMWDVAADTTTTMATEEAEEAEGAEGAEGAAAKMPPALSTSATTETRGSGDGGERRKTLEETRAITCRTAYAVSLRPMAESTLLRPDAIGCYANGNTLEHVLPLKDLSFFEKEEFWRLAKTLTDKISDRQRKNFIAKTPLTLEFLYSLFPREVGRIMSDRSGWSTKRLYDFRVSNVGPTSFLIKENGRRRDFEMTLKYGAVSNRFPKPCFIHYVVTVVDKICWSLMFWDDVGEEARIYARNIRNVLKLIETE